MSAMIESKKAGINSRLLKSIATMSPALASIKSASMTRGPLSAGFGTAAMNQKMR